MDAINHNYVLLRQQQPQQSQTNNNEEPPCKQRIRFALFIKILFKVIDDKLVAHQAKAMISSCIKEFRKGNSKYPSLMEAIEIPLRGLVGDTIWLFAYHYTELYQNKKSHIRHYKMLRSLPDPLSQEIPNFQEALL